MAKLSFPVLRFSPGIALAFLLPLLGTGCSSPKTTVTGQVKLDNEIVESGTVVFTPEEAGEEGGGTAQIIDGTYTLRSAKPGMMRIAVLPPTFNPLNNRARGGKIDVLTPPKDSDAPDHVGKVDEPSLKSLPPIPMNYKNPASSGLTFELKKGKNEHDIEMFSKPK